MDGRLLLAGSFEEGCYIFVIVFGCVLEGLPSTEVVHRRPGDPRPGIIELPVESPPRLIRVLLHPVHTNGKPNPISLHQPRYKHFHLEVDGLLHVVADVEGEDVEFAAMFLVELHDLGLVGLVFGVGSEELDGFEDGHGLGAVLAVESAYCVLVGTEF